MKYLLTIPAFLFATICFAQQKQYVFLLNNNGDKVHTKDSMDFIRVVKAPAAGSKLYDVTEYYPSGKPKSVGQSSGIDPVVLEGAYTTYWPNGTIKTTSTYKHSKIRGDLSHFFRNGQLHSVTTYTQAPDSALKDDPAKSPEIYFKTCNDSTGKALLVNGNGYFIDYDENSKINEEGAVKNGKRIGAWKGGDEKEQMTFTETYDDNGHLISGTSIDLAGTHTYKTRYVSAGFNGGIKQFYNYLSHIVRYPAIARENNIQGKVILSFTINKSGKLENIKVNQTVSYEVDAEAVKALKASPDWLPGMAYGRPVSQLYFAPISFSLRNR